MLGKLTNGDIVLLVDERIGSKELAPGLTALGLPVELCHLDFGDISFVGRGLGDEPLAIGIEFKKLGELVQALHDGRLAGHQLPGMVQSYERRYLLVEGELTVVGNRIMGRAGPMLGAPPATEFIKRLLTLAHRGGLLPWATKTRADTLRWIEAAYRFWTDKALHEHTSHIAVYNVDLDSRLGAPKSQFRQTISTLPGVGLAAGRAAEAHFGTLLLALTAPAEAWAELEVNGKRLGTKRALAIVRAIHGED